MTGYSFRATRWRTVRLVLVLGVAMAGGERSFIFQTLLTGAHAQSYGASLGFLSLPIETVSFVITNPTGDKAYNDRVTDGFRRYLAVYPGEFFNENRAAFAIARARRSPQVENVTYEYSLGRAGGLDITFRITLADGARTETGHGYLLTNNAADLPVLYDLDGTYVRTKLEALSLYYGNDNAWYGQPGQMLAGNPLVKGTPAGSGYSDWVEGYVHYGLYGITPLTENLYVYGGVSGITSGSTGQELFTDETRGYTYFEDAYAGLVTAHRREGQPARLQFQRRPPALHAGECLPHRQHGRQRRGPRGAPGQCALGLRPPGPRRRSPTTTPSSRPSTSTPTNSRSSTATPSSQASTSKAVPSTG